MKNLLKKFAWITGMMVILMGVTGCGGGGGDDLPNSSDSTSVEGTKTSWNYDSQSNSFTLGVSLTNGVDATVTLDHFALYLGGCQIKDGTLLFNGATDTTLVFRTAGETQPLTITGQLVDPTCVPTGFILSYHEVVEKDGMSKEGDYSINLGSSSDSTAPGETTDNGYSFYNIGTPVTVTQTSAQYEIKAQLLKDGFAAPNETVKLKPFDDQYGTVASSSVVTDSNGYAIFQYTSPATLPPSGTSTTLTLVYDDEGTTLEAEIVLNFGQDAAVIPEYNLTSISSPLTVRSPGELLQISAVVVDKNNVPVSGHRVSITALSSLDYGSIISATTVESDESGHVYFTYKAPDDVVKVDGNSTTVTLILQEDSYSVTQDVNITFEALMEENIRPIIVIPQVIREVNLTANFQPVEMNIEVFEEGTNNPYTSGTVKVKLPSKVLDGVDVGSFDAYEVPVGSNGIATFKYTGPQDLQKLIDSGDTGSSFEFYHLDNPTSLGTVNVNYTPEDSYQPANYILSMESSDGNFTMGLLSEKTFSILLKDDQGNLVADEDILELNISSKNFSIGKLLNTSDNTETDHLVFSGEEAVNNKAFPIRSNTISGLVPIEISVKFLNGNGEEQVLKAVANITVFSGPPTALSISYAGVRHDEEHAKFIELFDVTVTDAYNNPVNTQPYISVGAIVEYAVDGSSATGERAAGEPRLWHGFAKDSSGNYLDTFGTLEKVGDDQARFISDVTDTFRYVDLSNDKLVLFGAGYVYEALGKWDIESLDGSNDILNLIDNYFGETREGLGFAVGHNSRQDLCSGDAREYVGNMKSNSYQVDGNGHVLVEFEYDYHLTGKDITVWVNLTGYQADSDQITRIGEAQKHTLRGLGFKSDDDCTLAPGETRLCWFNIHHADVPEWYKNGHFGTGTVGKCKVLNIVDWSNFHDARDCANDGIAYIELNVTNTTGDDCTIGLDRIMVSPEFESSKTW